MRTLFDRLKPEYKEAIENESPRIKQGLTHHTNINDLSIGLAMDLIVIAISIDPEINLDFGGVFDLFND